MASSSTQRSEQSSSWSTGGRARESPIPYRIRPLDYEPPVFCKCKKKAAMWISWSNPNPGRRYFKCFRAREGGCDFICWYDEPTTDFLKEVLRDLCDTVWELKRERSGLRQELHAQGLKLEQANAVIAESKREIDLLSLMAGEEVGEMDALRLRVRRLEKERSKWKALCVGIGAVAVGLFWKLAML